VKDPQKASRRGHHDEKTKRKCRRQQGVKEQSGEDRQIEKNHSGGTEGL
jgi:hypothetical protein